ncbi:Pectinesterase inhibitor domain [Dillenia turbinata]|uniref:Pectinesterase inhibitor domain n=1 Tax=Dillenia turbinata TaxID=194707 RepID=A0AAN8VWZ0_9MAGN
MLAGCYECPENTWTHEATKASQGSIIVKYSFCVSSLANDTRSETAKSIEELGGIAIQHTISYGNRIQTDVASQLKNPKLSTDFRIAFQSCFTYYSDAIPKLESALNSFGSRDYPTAHQNLVSAMDASTDCQDAFDGIGSPTSMREDSSYFFSLTAIPFVLTNILAG